MKRGRLVQSSTTPPLKRGMTPLRCVSVVSSELLCFFMLNEMLDMPLAKVESRYEDEDSGGIIDDERQKGESRLIVP